MPKTCSIIHSTKGRTRLQLHQVKIQSNLLEAKIRSFSGITSASYSKATNTVLIYHQYSYLPKNIFTSIQSFLKAKEISLKNADAISKKQQKDLAIVIGAYVIEKMALQSIPFIALSPTSIAVLFASRSILKNGIKAIKKPNPDTLTTASMIASILKGSPQSAFVIYAMSTVSDILTEYTTNQTRNYVRKMMEIDTPETWLVANSGETIKVSTDIIKKGDKIIVFHGEKVSFDGIVSAYEGYVEQSSITGEYMPKHVSQGAYVYAGSIVTQGKIMIEVDKVGEDLTVNRMIKLIEDAQKSRASIQSTSEKFTEKMVPVSFILAGLIYLFTKDWNKVLNMLVIDYACGVKFSTATALSASIGKAARKGILIKGGQPLETLSKVNTVIFDKTGTITEGRPTVQNIITTNGYTENQVLAYAASAEMHSSHPIAEAILGEAKKRAVTIPEHDSQTIENIIGKGISVVANNQQIVVGNRQFMKDYYIEALPNVKSGIFVAKEKQLIGIIDIDDKVRQGMDYSIQQMRKNGVEKIIMLTGDQKEPAKKIAKRIAIDEFIAEAMPEDKLNFVSSIVNEKNRVTMMVGDGINDAPALANAHIGVSLGGKKTDIAMEASDIVIHSDNPMLLPEVIQISKQTMKTIRHNIIATLVINTAAITLGSFGFFPAVVGAAIHNISTIGVVLNSARLILPERSE